MLEAYSCDVACSQLASPSSHAQSNHFTGIRFVNPVLVTLLDELGVEPSSTSILPSHQPLKPSVAGELAVMHSVDSVFWFSGFNVSAVFTLAAPLTATRLSALGMTIAESEPVMRASVLCVSGRLYWAPHLLPDLSTLLDSRDVETLDPAIEQEVRRPLDLQRQLWRLTRLHAKTGPADARDVLVLKFHHCLGDGAWFASLLQRVAQRLTACEQADSKSAESDLVSAARTTAPLPMQASPSNVPSSPIAANNPPPARQPCTAGVLAAAAYNSLAWTIQLRALLSSARLQCSWRSLPFVARSVELCTSRDEIAVVRSALGDCRPTVTEVMITALAGCLRSEIEKATGAPPRRRLLVFVPVMLPHASDATDSTNGTPLIQHVGNVVSGCFIELPCEMSDPLARLRCVQKQTSAVRRWRVAVAHALLMRAGIAIVPWRLLPHIVRFITMLGICVGISSFRGPTHGLWLGVEVRTMYYYGFFEPASMPLMFSISTIADRMVVALASTCKQLGADDPNMLLQRIPEELSRLKEAVCG